MRAIPNLPHRPPRSQVQRCFHRLRAVVDDDHDAAAIIQRVLGHAQQRVVFDDGWGLVRASSNLPELVLIFEAKTDARLREIRELFRKRLAKHPQIDMQWENDMA